MNTLEEICKKGIDGILQEGDILVEKLAAQSHETPSPKTSDVRIELPYGAKWLVKHKKEIYDSVPDYEQYAYLYSKTLSSEVFDKDEMSIDQYVKIEYKGKKIYRKCAAKAGLRSDEVSLGNRSIKELGIENKINKAGDVGVCVTKSNWFMYQMFNGDKSLKMAFVFTIFSLICTVFSSLKDIIELFRF